jgi:pSer/pThr/pTyr-binding forkhead associated (FHA) protein
MDAATVPWLACWDAQAQARRWPLEGDVVTIGRTAGADVVLADDPLVSRLHARLERAGDRWTLVDDGLSRNGTWVRGARVTGRVWLQDRDDVRVGSTVLVFCAPAETAEPPTLVGEPLLTAAVLTPAQRAVVAALCRPYRGGEGAPATNAQIAAELVLSVDAVKTHLRAVAHRLGLDGLPQNEKRLRVAQLAVRLGLGDVGSPPRRAGAGTARAPVEVRSP